eukprot:CAMPEP_0116543014 /NCGR_PEP_ID=MMETSP0397-20121206/1328_1 /TAXON_ID=216820 /ORGANISM="Cyclophora tenuis, Strain ECT3854" /LENGTH=552 /DNA_ID=CAMNT_0004067071 /DNA_START=115 /DNA_END=1773 /DNA_ORIENTATION=+
MWSLLASSSSSSSIILGKKVSSVGSRSFMPAQRFARALSTKEEQSYSWRTKEKAFPAQHYHKLDKKDAVQCGLCPRHCKILPNRFGFCGVRGNLDGELVTYNFGRSVQAALETIETEAVYHYQPGASILSLGNIGCMMSCTFCHNWQTSQVKHLADKSVHYYTPEEVVEKALESNIGIISWTYNDPVVWHEFVCKTAELAQKHGIKNLYKSAFYIEEEPIKELCEVIDIFSLSLKSMDDKFYRKVCNGRLEPVLRGIEQVYHAGKHLEVSQLLVTDQNDSAEQCRETARWHAQALAPDVPLHFVRFHPAFQYTGVGRTPLDRLYRAREIAYEEGLEHVYIGNVYEAGCSDTKCSSCGITQVQRFGLTTNVVGIDKDTNTCVGCGAPSSIKYPHDGIRFSTDASDTSHGNVEDLLRGSFSTPPEKLVSDEVSWTEEINSVHVVFNQDSEESQKLVVVREPMDEAALVSQPLGRVILSRSSPDESGIRVFSGSEFQLFTVLDRAHFPVYADEKDGDGPSTLQNYAGGVGSSLKASSSSVRTFGTTAGIDSSTDK